MPLKKGTKRSANKDVVAPRMSKRRVTRSVAKQLLASVKKLCAKEKLFSIPPGVFAENVSSFLDPTSLRTTMDVGPLASNFELGKYCCKQHGVKFDAPSVTLSSGKVLKICLPCRNEEKDKEMKAFGMFRCTDCDGFGTDVRVCDCCAAHGFCSNCISYFEDNVFACVKCEVGFCYHCWDCRNVQTCEACMDIYCGGCSEKEMMGSCKICDQDICKSCYVDAEWLVLKCQQCNGMFCSDCDENHEYCFDCELTVCSECIRKNKNGSFKKACDRCEDFFCTRCDIGHEHCQECTASKCGACSMRDGSFLAVCPSCEDLLCRECVSSSCSCGECDTSLCLGCKIVCKGSYYNHDKWVQSLDS